MEKGIKIRKIRAEDFSEIAAIQESILQKKVSKKWVQMAEGHLKKQEALCFVALKDGQVVGFIIGEIKGEGFGLEQSGWIQVVGVHPRQMGVGIGRILAGKLVSFFKKEGLRAIHTAVRWDAVDMLSFFKIHYLIHQKKRIAVRQNLHYLFNIKRRHNILKASCTTA